MAHDSYHVTLILLMEKQILHHLGCPKCWFYPSIKTFSGILSGAGFFPTTVCRRNDFVVSLCHCAPAQRMLELHSKGNTSHFRKAVKSLTDTVSSSKNSIDNFFQLEKHTQILLLILRQLLVFLRDEDAAGKKQSVEVFLVVIVLRLKSW